MARKRIDADMRQKVLEVHATGLSMRKIAERFGISATSVGRIIREKSNGQSVKKNGKSRAGNAIMQKKILDLERRLAELETKILEYEARMKRQRRPA
ncbi:MAG: helix-turn-helix domain-containing protein [Desulfatiglandaceae bacterium]|jgi:transposase